MTIGHRHTERNPYLWNEDGGVNGTRVGGGSGMGTTDSFVNIGKRSDGVIRMLFKDLGCSQSRSTLH